MIYDVADREVNEGAGNTKDSDIKKNMYPCQFGRCKEKSFGSRSHLYEHYSLVHRREKLARYVPKGNQCNIVDPDGSICKTVFQDETAKIRHLGTVHRMVEKFLPKSLWVDIRRKGYHSRKRKRKMKKKKTKRHERKFGKSSRCWC